MMPDDSACRTGPTPIGARVRALLPVARTYLTHAELLRRSAPVATLTALVLTLAGATATTAGILLLGRVVGAGVAAVGHPGGAAADRALAGLGWLAVSFLVPPLAAGALNVLSQHITAAAIARVTALTSEYASAPDGIGRLEEAQEAGRLQRMAQAVHEWTYLEGIAGTWTVLQTRLSGLGAFAVIAGWHWWAAVILAFGHLVTGRALTAWLLSIFADMALDPPIGRRRATYLYDLLMRPDAAKEIRLFGLPTWLIQRHGTLWHDAMRGVWRRRNASIRPVVASTGVMLVCAAVFYGVLGREAWSGSIPVATVTALVGASIGLQALGMLGDEQVLFSQATATTHRLRQARREIDLPGLQPRPSASSTMPSPTPPATRSPAPRPVSGEPGGAASIRIRDLHFGYPGRDTSVFAGLDLNVPAGQSIAVVGVNGAGKSTLIKLLCGLYRPDRGEVLVDGSDPGLGGAAQQRVAVIFQEFVRYPLSLMENIALGARGAADTDLVVRRAAEDAGAIDVLERLGGDWDVVLSGEYAGGTDLSGGQWQRVALARALAAVAGGSGVLVLDEPTAALDVRAEAELFDRFLRVTRGMTTVLVSHRLSSVRHVDRIVVIDGGRIVEDGSHEELMRRGGRYADMFSLQASRFAAAAGSTRTEESTEEVTVR